MVATAGFMIHVICRLTANSRDQLRNPTLGNRVWATFTFFILVVGIARLTLSGEKAEQRESDEVDRVRLDHDVQC